MGIPSSSLSLFSAEQIMGERGLDVNYKLLVQMPTLTILPPVSVHFLGSRSESTSAHPTPSRLVGRLWFRIVFMYLAPQSPARWETPAGKPGILRPSPELTASSTGFMQHFYSCMNPQTKTVTLAPLGSALESWPETKCQGEMETSVPDPVPASHLPLGLQRGTCMGTQRLHGGDK